MQSEFNKASPSGWGWQWILLAIAGAMVLGPVQAAILTVTNTNDSGAGSLRQAIADASGSDTITFDSALAGSTITLTSGELVLAKDLSIEGDLDSDGVPDVTVSGNDSSRVFFVNSGTTASVEGLVITAGRAFEGGGIHNEGTLRLSNSTVSGNEAVFSIFGGIGGGGPGGSGGGISNTSGTLTLTNSTVSDNEALHKTPGPGGAGSPGSGGGISNINGTVTLTNSTVSDNRAEGGSSGGILNREGALTLIKSTVSDNSMGGIGNFDGTVTVNNSTVSVNKWRRGISNSNGNLTLINSTVSDNSRGGIGNFDGTVTVTNSTVSDNNTFGNGGGIINNGTLTLTNSTVSHNEAVSGGGIHNQGTLTLTNSTISGNEARDPPLNLPGPVSGGGIFNGSMLRIVNTIIANSETNGVEGGDCENIGTLDTANSADNLIETGCDVVATLTDDPELGPLQDNGGPTETHALMLGSPAIDFIPIADCEVSEDQRGVSRPQGFGCDIGAFEREVIPIPPGPPAPVPAAGKWALGMLAVLLLSAMVWLGGRQQGRLKG